MSDIDQVLKFKDALANAILVLPAGVKNHPGVRFQVFSSGIEVSATDGYVYVSTMVARPCTARAPFFMDKATAKTLVASEDPFDFLDRFEGDKVDPSQHGILNSLYVMASSSESDTWMSTLAFAPDRVKKLGSLKPAGLPIEVYPASDNGLSYARFAYGSNTIGVFTLLDTP